MYGMIELVNEGFQFLCFIFIEFKESLISFTQSTSFSVGRNTLNERVFMYQTRHVILSTRIHHPSILYINRGAPQISCSENFNGRNMVWVPNNATILTHSAQVGSSMVIVLVSPMNPNIEDYFVLISTVSVSSITSGFDSCRYSFPGSKCI